MKLCGVANSVYLVEDYGDIAHCKVSQRGLYQAITNTQVKLIYKSILIVYKSTLIIYKGVLIVYKMNTRVH